MCDGLAEFGWVMVSENWDTMELESSFFLYSKDVLLQVLCDTAKKTCEDAGLYYKCTKHECKSGGKRLPVVGQVSAVDKSLFDGLPFLRAKVVEAQPYLCGLERALWSLDLVPAVHLTVYFNLLGFQPPHFALGWVARAKLLSAMLKSLDVGVDCLRWVEMQQCQGYDYHQSDINAVAAKFCKGNGNIPASTLIKISDAFWTHAGSSSWTYVPYEDYIVSGKWQTSGSASGVKRDWSIDGKMELHRLTKNQLEDWFSTRTLAWHFMKLDTLDCVLANKNEVGKQRPVVGADPWSYVFMSWVMDCIKPWLTTIPGFFVYVEEDAIITLARSIGRKEKVIACRGDDLIVTLADGRVLSFDFPEFDHEVPMWFTRLQWDLLTRLAPVSVFERDGISKVSYLLGNVVLHWYDKGVQHSSPLTGSLASGIRLTTVVGTIVSLGLGLLLRSLHNPWPAVEELRIPFNRSKCYVRNGGEFLRTYMSEEWAASYPARSVIAFLQHKPWLDGEQSRVEACFKALFVTMQRLGAVPPHGLHVEGTYGCPKLYGGHGVAQRGFDFCLVERDDDKSLRGVSPYLRLSLESKRNGLPEDIDLLSVVVDRQRELYGANGEEYIVGGGYKKNKRVHGLGPVRQTYRLDMFKYAYYVAKGGFYFALSILNPSLGYEVRKLSKWGRTQAFKVCLNGPELPMTCRLYCPSSLKRPMERGPGADEEGLRTYYRSQFEELNEMGYAYRRVAT